MMDENRQMALEKLSREDREEKLALKLKEEEYYNNKMEEIGLKKIDRFVEYCPNPSKSMKRGITFAHRDLEMIAESIAEEKPWSVISGLNPSGPLHFGHKAIFDELLWMQSQGAEIFIPLTNDESYVVGKAKSLAESRKIAYEKVIPSIIAFGFNPEKTHLFVESDYTDIYNVAMDLSNKLTLNKVFKVFGFDQTEEGENPGTLFYRSAVQIAQILLPQYDEFGGPKPTLVPVGIDQHPYILLSRDVAEKKAFIPPAELVTKFLPSFDGKGKMAASRRGSAIYLTDDIQTATKTLKSAYTGGSPIGSFQKEHGGIPEICPVGQLRRYHFEEDDSVANSCRAGELLCGECKKAAICQVTDYLTEHQEKFEQAGEKIDDFLLKTPIRSIL